LVLVGQRGRSGPRGRARSAERAPATVNNILTLLSTGPKTAIEGVIETMPRIRKLKREDQGFSFHDEGTFDRRLTAASASTRGASSGCSAGCVAV
jgi:hypothetical protein